MKNLLRFLAFVLMVGSAYAQNSQVHEPNKKLIESGMRRTNLPDCPSIKTAPWNQCFGSYVYSFGEQYIGEFKDNKRNGLGVLYGQTGQTVMSGLWLNDELQTELQLDTKQYPFISQPNAARVAQRPNVIRFEREQLNIQIIGNLSPCPSVSVHIFLHNCFGTKNFANGDKYVGEFWLNKPSGKGTLFASNGSVISEGIWADGNFVRSAPVQQTSMVNQTVAIAAVQPNTLSSNLPPCQGSDKSRWNSCVGIENYQSPVLRKFVGIYFNGERNGFGIEYANDGSVISSGTWKGSFNLVASHYVDTQRFPFNSLVMAGVTPTSTPDSGKAEHDRFNAEIEVERKKRQELEQQLAAKERERITAELDQERKKRQELEAQLAASPQPSAPQAIAPRRVAHALVIGNGAYPSSGRLDNPVNDANAISQKLRSMGFTVTTVTDANRQRLVQSMAQFRRTAASADISLLYYAGHGVQIFGTNYILPTDVDQTDPAQATIQGVSLNSVVENFLPGKTKLVFLDACRDNALQRTNDRSVSKGLAPISAAEGTLISYATKDGQTAADGVGSKNSPFTQALLEHLSDPQDIAVVLRKVRERVMKITGGKQQPWEYGSLTGGELVLSAIKPK